MQNCSREEYKEGMFCTWIQGHGGLAVAFMYLILMFIQMCRLFYFPSELVLPNKSDSFPFFFISQWHWKLNTKLKVIHCTAKKIGRWTRRFERHSSWCQQREARDETRKREFQLPLFVRLLFMSYPCNYTSNQQWMPSLVCSARLNQQNKKKEKKKTKKQNSVREPVKVKWK